MKKIIVPVLVLLINYTAYAQTSEIKAQHYPAKPSANLNEALANLNSHNKLLADILADQPLDAAALDQVHQLTYTLELAVAKVEESVSTLKETLENVHQASENGASDAVTEQGKAYLDLSKTLLNQ